MTPILEPSHIAQLIKALIVKRLPLALIALFFVASPSLSFANPDSDNQSNPPAAAATPSSIFSPDEESVEQAKKREAMEEAILHEKLKMGTQARDSKNEQRAAGRILGFDVFLGAFLTLLWSMISFFIATRLSPESGENGHTRAGVRIYYSVAALVPLMLLWVSISTGYLSWWLTFTVSAVLYWLPGQIFKKIKVAR
jgi:hypothetical protein